MARLHRRERTGGRVREAPGRARRPTDPRCARPGRRRHGRRRAGRRRDALGRPPRRPCVDRIGRWPRDGIAVDDRAAHIRAARGAGDRARRSPARHRPDDPANGRRHGRRRVRQRFDRRHRHRRLARADPGDAAAADRGRSPGGSPAARCAHEDRRAVDRADHGAQDMARGKSFRAPRDRSAATEPGGHRCRRPRGRRTERPGAAATQGLRSTGLRSPRRYRHRDARGERRGRRADRGGRRDRQQRRHAGRPGPVRPPGGPARTRDGARGGAHRRTRRGDRAGPGRVREPGSGRDARDDVPSRTRQRRRHRRRPRLDRSRRPPVARRHRPRPSLPAQSDLRTRPALPGPRTGRGFGRRHAAPARADRPPQPARHAGGARDPQSARRSPRADRRSRRSAAAAGARPDRRLACVGRPDPARRDPRPRRDVPVRAGPQAGRPAAAVRHGAVRDGVDPLAGVRSPRGRRRVRPGQDDGACAIGARLRLPADRHQRGAAGAGRPEARPARVRQGHGSAPGPDPLHDQQPDLALVAALHRPHAHDRRRGARARLRPAAVESTRDRSRGQPAVRPQRPRAQCHRAAHPRHRRQDGFQRPRPCDRRLDGDGTRRSVARRRDDRPGRLHRARCKGHDRRGCASEQQPRSRGRGNRDTGRQRGGPRVDLPVGQDRLHRRTAGAQQARDRPVGQRGIEVAGGGTAGQTGHARSRRAIRSRRPRHCAARAAGQTGRRALAAAHRARADGDRRLAGARSRGHPRVARRSSRRLRRATPGCRGPSGGRARRLPRRQRQRDQRGTVGRHDPGPAGRRRLHGARHWPGRARRSERRRSRYRPPRSTRCCRSARRSGLRRCARTGANSPMSR